MLKINAPPPIPSERIVGRGRKKGICVCVCVTTNDGGNLTAHRILDALVDRGPEGTFVVFVYAKRHTAAIYFGTIRFFFFDHGSSDDTKRQIVGFHVSTKKKEKKREFGRV